jgi:hypothetical protein
MNPAIFKMVSAMIGPAEIGEMIDSLAPAIVKYTESFALLEGEEEATIILFEDKGQLCVTIAAIDDNNRIVRQIETMFIKDLFLKLLKK